MDAVSILQQTGAVDSIAKELGVSPQVAAAGAAALLPAIMGGFKREAQAQPSGVDGMIGAIRSLGGGGLLDSVLGTQPTPVDQGNQILGQIFGSKDVSRQVAGQAESQSGVSSELLKRMLPILAMAVAGYLARSSGSESGDTGGPGGALGGILGSALGGGGSQSGGGLGGLGSLLDMDGDGNPLDDILNMATRR